MTARLALVVDDSRSARAFLTRILERYELAVDGVESAEQAIEYLTQQRPDVIFMDHLMPGMDGFQAVQAIKENPLTATIPILMYTSQEGELYLSQARALGALGVLPKQTKHTDVAKALNQLHLLGEQRLESEIIATPPEEPTAETRALASEDTSIHAAAHTAALEETADFATPSMAPPGTQDSAAATAAAAAAATATATAADATRAAHALERRRAPRPPNLPVLSPELRAVFESMVLHHIRNLQRFVADHVDTQAERVVADVRLMLKDQPPPLMPIGQYGPPESSSSGGIWIGIAGVIIACFALWQWQQERLDAASLATQLSQAQQQLESGHGVSPAAAALAPDAAGGAAAVDSAPVTNVTIEPVPYGEMPLAGSRLDRIQALLAKLNAQGFQGDVDIRSIPGRFCMLNGAGQMPALAADTLPFARCDQIGNPREDNGSVSLRQSVAFANMIAIARHNGNGKLNIQIDAGTADETVTPYPPISDSLSAGDWNRVAMANNRVEVHWQARH
jgi:CheY-like chemotaxis protein